MSPKLPDTRNYGNLALLKPQQQYILLRQLHKAKRAGLHVDFRIGAPQLGLYSWAAPKDLPTQEGQKRLLITQPLHTYAYKDFQGNLFSRYGRGTVKKLQQSPVIILQNTGDRIRFARAGEKDTPVYTMIRTKNGNWITTMKNMNKKAALTQTQLQSLAKPYYTPQKWHHIQEVLQQAKDIKQQPLSNLQNAAIYLHDIQKKRIGNRGHQKASAILARKLLQGKYSKDQVRKIYKAILQHNPDYRGSVKGFKHSSPQAQLLAIADDSNNLRRDPDLLAMYSVQFTKGDPRFGTFKKSLARHKAFFGPQHAHPQLIHYKDRWKQYAKAGVENIDNYPAKKYKLLWNLIGKDTPLPDLYEFTKPLKMEKTAASRTQMAAAAKTYYQPQKWQHIKDVLRIAQQIKGKRLSPLQNAAILWHDTAKRDMGGQFHGQNGARIAQRDLKRWYTPQQVALVAKAIRQHNLDQRVKDQHTLEQAIPHFSSPQAQLLAIADDDRPLEAQKTWNKVLRHNIKGQSQDKSAAQLVNHMKLRLDPRRRMPQLKHYKQQFQQRNKPFINWLQRLSQKDAQTRIKRWKQDNGL